MSHLDEGLLTALLDNELEEAERRSAETHLAECGECRRLLDEVKSFAAEADGLVAAVELPPKRPAQIVPLPTGAGSVAGSKPSGRPMPWRTLAWAASVVLAAGLGWTASDLHWSDRTGEPDRIAATVAEPKAAAAPAPAPAVAAAKPTGSGPALEKESAQTQPSAFQASAPQEERANVAPTRRPAPTVAPRDAASRMDESAEKRAGEADLKGFVDAAVPAPFGSASTSAGSPAVAGKTLASPGRQAGFRQVDMEEAVRTLGGSIRLVDGLQPVRILIGPAPIGTEIHSSPDLVRVVYQDPPGRELWLDQQRPVAEGLALRERGESGLLTGDTVFTLSTGGTASLRWVDQHAFRLALTGFLGADSLRALVERVH